MRRIYIILIIIVLCIALVFISANVTTKIQRKIQNDKNNEIGMVKGDSTTQREGNGLKFNNEGIPQEEHSMIVTSKLGYEMEYMDDLYYFYENESYSRYKYRENDDIYMTVEIFRQYDRIEAFMEVKENESEKVIYKKGNNRIYRIEMFYPEEATEGARAAMLTMIDTFKILKV